MSLNANVIESSGAFPAVLRNVMTVLEFHFVWNKRYRNIDLRFQR